jgi:hypothetical protein
MWQLILRWLKHNHMRANTIRELIFPLIDRHLITVDLQYRLIMMRIYSSNQEREAGDDSNRPRRNEDINGRNVKTEENSKKQKIIESKIEKYTKNKSGETK